jgi:hypothetical protein
MFKSQTSLCESEIIMDSDNLAMMESMLCKEQTIYAQHDYFARSLPIAPPVTSTTTPNNGNSSMPVDPLCRKIMAKWCAGLCKFCSYDQRMVASIMSCVDRFVATLRGSPILLDRENYQLAVMAALYMVSKIQQIHALEPESIAKLSRGKYTKADIETMELEILTSLEWFVNPPTPMGFAHEFLQNFEFVVPAENDDSVVGDSSENDESTSLTSTSSLSSTTNRMEERIMGLVKCQIEEATYDYKLSCLTRPSHVAFGAFSNALKSLNIEASDLDSMRMLKDRLQIITDDYNIDNVSDALLRAVSSSGESSNDPLSSLLLHRCNGHSNRARSNNSESPKAEQRTSSSVPAPSSPRTVLEGIPC